MDVSLLWPTAPNVVEGSGAESEAKYSLCQVGDQALEDEDGGTVHVGRFTVGFCSKFVFSPWPLSRCTVVTVPVKLSCGTVTATKLFSHRGRAVARKEGRGRERGSNEKKKNKLKRKRDRSC